MKISDAYYYVQGNLRYKLFYSKFAFLLPKYIKEQIDARISSMDEKCYLDGSCKLCSCSTTALQMANKACDKPCYPKMQKKKIWAEMKKNPLVFIIDNGIGWVLTQQGKFKQVFKI